ncbi:hypothetical protein MKP08_00940 [Erythrobacter sp. LQ02-29]|uniref:hypothetical protein n=1 Tax=Erythrobacter sp. LQ02-29 TaxID=2920384 RepID=UPI001F4D6FAB|nr:hypothetical protein [Erythrobacter sp. LQ02-29]MCP9221316.1 hypothetical protein [Erythrobacter sp. LQ02-29]
MTPKRDKTPPELLFDTWMLANEAAFVMWLRGWRMMAGGPLAEREANRMVSEKLTAAALLWPALLAGGPFQSGTAVGERMVEHYRKPVQANRRRLSRATR